MSDFKILSPLRDPTFYAALGTTIAGESAAFSLVGGTNQLVAMVAALAPLLTWLQHHSKHRLAALAVVSEVSRMAASEDARASSGV